MHFGPNPYSGPYRGSHYWSLYLSLLSEQGMHFDLQLTLLALPIANLLSLNFKHSKILSHATII